MISYNALQLHTKIRQVREIRHLTRESVADSLNITPRTYADIESGKAHITVKRLIELCMVLSCTIEDILYFSPDNFFAFDHQSEKDKMQMILYYREIIHVKDDLIQQLKKENIRLSTMLQKA